MILNTAARQQIGDAALSGALAVTTGSTTISVPAALRGKYVVLYASAGTIYLSSGTAAVTTANGFEVVSGTPVSVYIPNAADNAQDYELRAIGSEAATLKVVAAS
jgi:hypothetical protein